MANRCAFETVNGNSARCAWILNFCYVLCLTHPQEGHQPEDFIRQINTEYRRLNEGEV